MNFFMARSFDHGGYYETRIVLTVAAIAFAGWMWHARSDRRFVVAFVSGALFQGIMEFLLAQAGLRGAGYVPTLFGQALPMPWVFVLQGVVEGGPLTLMAFWFAELAGAPGRQRRWNAYLVAMAMIVGLSIIVSVAAAGEPYTSVRLIFRWDWIWFLLTAGAIVLVGALRGIAGLRRLMLFGAGVVVYLVATYEPMHVAGVRLIVEKAGGETHPADLWAQLWVMAYSHVIEVTGVKLHYFAIPLLLGLLDAPKEPRT